MNTVPYAFQVHAARFAHRHKYRCMFAMEAGLGKSLASLMCLERHPEIGPMVVVCPAVAKYNWEAEALKHFGWRAEILSGMTAPRHRNHGNRPVTVINYDILGPWANWIREGGVGTVVIDECFPHDTLVRTDSGNMPIGDIVNAKCEVKVASQCVATGALSFRRVTHKFKIRSTKRKVTVHHERGQFTCTEDHKIWTECRGYVEASKLTCHDRLRFLPEGGNSALGEQKESVLLRIMSGKECRQDQCVQATSEATDHLPPVWMSVHTDAVRNEKAEILLEKVFQPAPGISPVREEASSIHQRRNEKKDGERAARQEEARHRCKDDHAQPHERPENSEEDAGHEGEERHAARVEGREGRERQEDDATRSCIQHLVSGRCGMADGYAHQDRTQAEGRFGVSHELQSRHRQPERENLCGDRRPWTQGKKEKSTGQEEAGVLGISRVVRVEVHQRASESERDGGSSYDPFVYCIEVEGNHNFFAEGVLVSNCQMLQSRGTARLRAVRNLTRGVPRVMALSGTPLVNRPSELWPTLNIIRPDLYPDFRNYANLFCAPRRTHFGWSYDGASNLGLLHDQLSEFMLRMRKADVLHELPNKRTTVVPLPVTDMREYDRAEKTFLSWLAQNRPDKVMGALRAQRLVQIGYLKRLAAQLKLPSALAWIDSFLQNSDEKLIVFACHHDIIDAVRERYGKLCVHIDGRVSTRSRQAVVTAFQHDKRVRLFVGNIRAAGTAITLTAASTVAFIELDWTPGAHSQAGDRAHRLTQDRECEMVWLIAHGTIEETIASVIQRKQGVLDAVLDGGTPEEGGMDIHDELMAALGVS